MNLEIFGTGDLQVAKKRMLLNCFFLSKAEFGASLLVKFALPTLDTKDYPLRIDRWFR